MSILFYLSFFFFVPFPFGTPRKAEGRAIAEQGSGSTGTVATLAEGRWPSRPAVATAPTRAARHRRRTTATTRRETVGKPQAAAAVAVTVTATAAAADAARGADVAAFGSAGEGAGDVAGAAPRGGGWWTPAAAAAAATRVCAACPRRCKQRRAPIVASTAAAAAAATAVASALPTFLATAVDQVNRKKKAERQRQPTASAVVPRT